MADKHETCFVVQTLRNQINQHVYPVHRLDRPTSGVLVFALDSQTAGLLAKQFGESSHPKILLGGGAWYYWYWAD